MANYGESIAYWYLRLNGFFPLRNYVLEREAGEPRTTESDLLAMRFRWTHEEIGLNGPEDVDELFRKGAFDVRRWPTFLIVQVKAGHSEIDNKVVPFKYENLFLSIRRFGVLEERYAQGVARLLHGKPLVNVAIMSGGIESVDNPDNYANGEILTFGKILIAHSDPPCDLSCIFISIAKCEAWICSRIKEFRRQKRRDWNFFNEELMQYFIYRALRDD